MERGGGEEEGLRWAEVIGCGQGGAERVDGYKLGGGHSYGWVTHVPDSQRLKICFRNHICLEMCLYFIQPVSEATNDHPAEETTAGCGCLSPFHMSTSSF